MSLTIPNEVLAEIAEQLKKTKPLSATNEDLRDAWYTVTLSVGSGGAQLEGWLTYWDNTVVQIKLLKTTAQTGTAAAGTSIPVWLRVPPFARLVNPGVFDASGFGLLGGSIELTNCPRVNLVGAAPWDWHLAGTLSFEKA